MKNITTRTIKIMIDTGSLSAFDINEIERWENEGGNPTTFTDIFTSLTPLKQGDIFEVIECDFHCEGEMIFYEAKIELLPLPRRL